MTWMVSSQTPVYAACHVPQMNIRAGLSVQRKRQRASRAGDRRMFVHLACAAGATAATRQRRLSDAQILATLKRVHAQPPRKSERAAPRTRTVTTQARTGVTSNPVSARLNQTLEERARLTRTAIVAGFVSAATAATTIQICSIIFCRTALRVRRGLI